MLNLSLKSKITAMIAIEVTLSLLALGVATYVPMRNTLMRQEQTFIASLNGIKSKSLQGVLADVDGAVQTFSTSEYLRQSGSDKDNAMSRYLKEQQAAHRYKLAKIMLLDSSGQITAASDRALVGRRLNDFWRGTEINEKYQIASDSVPTALPFSEHATLASSKIIEQASGAPSAIVAYLNWNGLIEQTFFASRGDAPDRQDTSLIILLNGRGTVLGVSTRSIADRLWNASHPLERLQDLGLNVEGTVPAAGVPFAFTHEGRQYEALRFDSAVSSLGRDLSWSMIVGRDEAAADQGLMTLRWLLFLGSAGVILLCALFGYIMASRMSRSLLSLVPSFEKLAAGDLECTVRCETGDEVELISRHFNAFVAKLRSIVVNIVDSTLTLSESSQLLADLSQNLVGNAQETSSQAGAASKISDEVSTNINTVSAGVEEMSLSINEIARSSDEAARVATSAVRIAEMTNTTVAELGGSSSEIGNVIKVINSIAEQTNLLALNATIEAARAGEAGKGFAVVANEVKELAKETARATEDIGKKIEAIQAKTKGAVNAIGEIGSIINQVNDYQTTIASAVQEQLATTTEIGRNIAEVAERSYMITKNISTVAQIAQNASTGANETRTATSDVSRISLELHGLVESFRYTR